MEDLIDRPQRVFSVDHVGIADAFYHLSDGIVISAEENAGTWCIVMGRKIGRSGEIKTLATVWPVSVRFAIQNDGLLDGALKLGMIAKRDEESSKLRIVGLTRAVISKNSEFFRNLLDEVFRECTERQEH